MSFGPSNYKWCPKQECGTQVRGPSVYHGLSVVLEAPCGWLPSPGLDLPAKGFTAAAGWKGGAKLFILFLGK